MTEQEINNLIDSKIGKVKMSQLPEATQTSGLYSIGYTDNQSVKYKANLLQGDPLTVRKTYQTEVEALADKNPIDPITSLPLTVGQFVSIVDDGGKNGIYRIGSISGDGTMSLELQGKLGDLSDYTKTGGSTKTTKEIDDEKANHGYDSSPKTLKEVEDNTSVKIRSLITNGDFVNDVNGWSATGMSVEHDSGRLRANNWSLPSHRIISPDMDGLSIGDLLYLRIGEYERSGIPEVYNLIRVRISDIAPDIISEGGNPNLIIKNLSGIAAYNGETPRIHIRTYQGEANSVWIDDAICINLTEAFGAGNEPTKEEMDALMDIVGYFDGDTISRNQLMRWQQKLKANHGYESNPKTLKEVDDKLLQVESETNAKLDNVDIKLTNIAQGDFEHSIKGSMLAGSGLEGTLTHNSINPISGMFDSMINILNSGFNPPNRPLYIPTFIDSTQLVIGDTYAIVFKYKVNSGTPYIQSINNGLTYEAVDYFEFKNSGIYSKKITCEDTSVLFGRITFGDKNLNDWNMQFDDFMVINLSKAFQNNIPSDEEVFNIMQGINYFEGTMTLADFMENVLTVGSKKNVPCPDDPIVFPTTKKGDTVAKNILLTGSSITWGNGLMSELISGELLDYLYRESALMIKSDEVEASPSFTTFTNKKMLYGAGARIAGVGSKITFSFSSDEINICQAIQRTSNFADIIVKADGEQILKFNNKNNTIKTGQEQTFVGDGITNIFYLNYPHTYNYSLTVDGVPHPVIIKRYEFSSFPWGDTTPPNAVILRTWNDELKKVVHCLMFHEDDIPSNGAEIKINYDVGKVITIEDSTVGENITDDVIERVYGVGGTQFDPLNPSSINSGLEYRSIDTRSFQSYKFNEYKEREYEIEIVGGVNPYFIFNFATSKKHILTNAAMGGYGIEDYLAEIPNLDMNHETLFKFGNPDMVFIQGGLANDRRRADRKVKRVVENETEATALRVPTKEIDLITYVSPNNYTIRYCTGIIDSITPTSLISSDVINSETVVGDIIRIGNYYGDNRSVVTRRITDVSLTTGEVKWKLPLYPTQMIGIDVLDDLVGAEISVRDIEIYKDRLNQFINILREYSPSVKIILLTSENSNYFMRQSWGHDILYRELVNEHHNVDLINVSEWFDEKVNNWISGEVYEDIIADGSDTYTLEKTGNYQGFKVIVNGVDVYGKDCVIKIGQRYGINQSLRGSDINVEGTYWGGAVTENLELIFLKNAPVNGNIRIEYADDIWASDLTHVTDISSYMYSQLFKDKINKFI